MLAVRMCGPQVLARLESIGVRRLSDLAGRDPDELVAEVNIEAGRPIWHPPLATQAMSNLIAAAGEGGVPGRPTATRALDSDDDARR